MNNISFASEGPIMDGTWYNPQNGDSFTVRDTFFENNQLIVKTTDGRMLDYNFIQNYVKSDKPIQKIDKQPDIPKEVSDLLIKDDNSGMLEDDKNLIRPNLGNISEQRNQVQQQDTDLAIIVKALSKRTKPVIDFNIKWNEYPENEVDMLMNLMEIDKDKIINYYTSNIDIQLIKNDIQKSLEKYINKKITKVEPPKTESTEQPKKTKKSK